MAEYAHSAATGRDWSPHGAAPQPCGHRQVLRGGVGAVGPCKPWRRHGPGCGGLAGRARRLETEGTSIKWQVQRHLPPLKFSLRAPGCVAADSICTKRNTSAPACTTEISNCARFGLSSIKGQSEHEK